jgi:hypothetical protein
MLDESISDNPLIHQKMDGESPPFLSLLRWSVRPRPEPGRLLSVRGLWHGKRMENVEVIIEYEYVYEG